MRTILQLLFCFFISALIIFSGGLFFVLLCFLIPTYFVMRWVGKEPTAILTFRKMFSEVKNFRGKGSERNLNSMKKADKIDES
jgi:hypothetical protein